jgi:CHASE2 domain-containing sensor protein
MRYIIFAIPMWFLYGVLERDGGALGAESSRALSWTRILVFVVAAMLLSLAAQNRPPHQEPRVWYLRSAGLFVASAAVFVASDAVHIAVASLLLGGIFGVLIGGAGLCFLCGRYERKSRARRP